MKQSPGQAAMYAQGSLSALLNVLRNKGVSKDDSDRLVLEAALKVCQRMNNDDKAWKEKHSTNPVFS